MKRKYHFFLALIIFLMLSATGCNAAPAYSTFHPQPESLIRLEFEYPSDWVFIQGYGDFFEFTNDDRFPGVTFYVSEFDDKRQRKEYLDNRIQGSLDFGINRDAVVRYEPVIMDGYSGVHIFLDIPVRPFGDITEPWIQEVYFLLVGDRLIYELLFNIDEDQRDGEFGRGFDHLIETLKVLNDPYAP